MDYELQSEYLSTGSTDLLNKIQDQQWAARAALETLYTQERDAADMEALLHIGLQATQEPGQDAQYTLLRQCFVDLRRRADCVKQIAARQPDEITDFPSPRDTSADADESGWDLDEDDDSDMNVSHPEASTSKHPAGEELLPLTLFEFLTTDLFDIAARLAELSETRTLQHIVTNFRMPLDQLLRVCNDLPLSVDSIELVSILTSATQPKTSQQTDWSDSAPSSKADGLPPDQLTQWYLQRATRLDTEAGLLDQAFLLLQHAASKGVPGLDGFGEELSLLCKLVYDRPGSPTGEDWSLQRWKDTPPEHIFVAYLEQSTPATVDKDVRRLALPYAFVLEAQAERSGHPMPDLHSQMLRTWLFNCVVKKPSRIDLVASIIQHSKPDIDAAKRLIKDDVELARIALSVVYGDPSIDQWSSVSAIVDCLPALDSAGSGSEASSKPPQLVSTASPKPQELYDRLQDFSKSDMSRAMDALDVHVEQAEILARWHAPVRLSWFSQHAQDAAAQKSLLIKVSNAACRASQRGADWMENQDDWEALMEDLTGMARPEKDMDSDLLPAFGQLDKQEILNIFFKALLRSGSISIAKSLFNPSTGVRPVEPAFQEQLCIETSRELYDNAENANLHGGDLKLAYDCLSIAPQTPTIRQEREFIEATSRLASYNLQRSGSPISPIQIRLTNDKLSLIEELLQTSEDAHRHPDLLLDLTAKLGYRADKVAEVKVLAMVVLSHLRRRETGQAVEVAQRMIKTTESLRLTQPAKFVDASNVAWKACQAAGQAADASQGQADLLGQALLLCPAAAVTELLSSWRAAEKAQQSQPATSKPTLSRINTASPTLNSSLNSLGQAASSYLGRPESPAALSPASALDHLMHGREGGVRDRLQTGMTSGLRWLVEG